MFSFSSVIFFLSYYYFPYFGGKFKNPSIDCIVVNKDADDV